MDFGLHSKKNFRKLKLVLLDIIARKGENHGGDTLGREVEAIKIDNGLKRWNYKCGYGCSRLC